MRLALAVQPDARRRRLGCRIPRMGKGLSESNQEFSWLLAGVAIEAKFGTFEASFYVQLPFRKVS